MLKEGITIFEVAWSTETTKYTVPHHRLFLFKKDAEDFKERLLAAEELLAIPTDEGLSRCFPIILEREVSKHG